MSEENEERVKNLAEIKAWLERKISELSQELEMYRRVSSVVDEQLAELSFKRVDMLAQRRAEHLQDQDISERPVVKVIRSRSGSSLATLTYTRDEARFILSPELYIRRDDKPFSSFLVRKVLEAMSRADLERAEVGEIDRDRVLTYDISYEDDRVKEIIIKNYREESRLRELINSVRWTLETISSK